MWCSSSIVICTLLLGLHYSTELLGDTPSTGGTQESTPTQPTRCTVNTTSFRAPAWCGNYTQNSKQSYEIYLAYPNYKLTLTASNHLLMLRKLSKLVTSYTNAIASALLKYTDESGANLHRREAMHGHLCQHPDSGCTFLDQLYPTVAMPLFPCTFWQLLS